MHNARLLSVAPGAGAIERIATYRPEGAAAEAAALADAVAVAIDAPGDDVEPLLCALAAAGARGWAAEGRLIVAGTREAVVRACEVLSGEARTLGNEIVRALDADRAPAQTLRLRNRSLDLLERARVMGILNVTPNSFFDRGRYNDVDRARERAAEMVALGADLIDIGGQSYSSANARIAAQEEADRVIPVVRALVRDGIAVPLSIDTFRASVAERALDEGAHLINDCSGLSDDRMPATVARANAGLVVMHLRGELNVRESRYPYADAMGEILDYLRIRTERALAAGVRADAVVVDPGLEFGKEPETDLEILERFGDLRSLGYAILFAASRKSFIGRIFDRPASELLVPSLATAAVGIAAGARLVRVHDVAETVATAKMLAALRPEHRSKLALAAEA